jgi:hypothetical protein
MCGCVVAGGRLRPPDGASCSRRAGLQQCKSCVEMCIVSCLNAAPACVCGRGLQPGTALVVVCLAVVTLPPRSTAPTVAGCRLVGCSVVSGRPLRSRAVAGVSLHVCVGLGPVLASHAPSPPAAAAAERHNPKKSRSYHLLFLEDSFDHTLQGKYLNPKTPMLT